MKRFRDPLIPSEPAGQRPHLDIGEGEVLVGDPDHLAGGLTPREGNVRCLAPGQHEVGRRRQRSRDLAEERRSRRARRDLVHVVKQQAHIQWRPPDQRVDDFPRPPSSSAARPASTPADGHGVEKRRGKAERVFVCRLTAQPHVNPAGRGLVSPYCLSQNGCLAEARPRNEQRHGPVPAALEQPNEPQSRYLDVEGTRQAERAGQQRHGRRGLSGGQMAGRHRLASWTWSVHRVHALRSTAPHTLMLTAYTASVQEDCRLQQRSLVAWFAPGQYLVRSLGGDPCAALAPEYENVHWGGPLPLPR